MRSESNREQDLGRRWQTSAARVWLLVPLLWIIVSLISSANGGMMIAADGHAEPMPWRLIFTTALYDNGWWMVLAPLIAWAVSRLESSSPTVRRRVTVHVLLGVASVLAFHALRSQVHLPGDAMRVSTGWRGLRSVLGSALAFYVLIAASSAAVIAYRRVREREREAAALALRTSRLETQLVEAQLGVLRAQLHPHFLFNALHAVSSLIDWRPKEARRMLTRLSELLRLAIGFSELREIALTRELEWLERYIELQQIRFGERLAVDVRVAPDAMDALVPPLVLQPLVENAIRYGVEPRTEGGHVEIAAEREGKWLRLRVSDDGPGITGASSSGTGIGLRNTRDRLHALYGDDQQVLLRDRAPRGAESVVEIPYRALTLARAEPRAG